ncbi:MAG: tyrosine-protein phosphatase [Tannerellaceae bacterium]|jgi:protein-tyrosine phosphatase|nr:tyrosine-protein phosphatase [Tannerellaceae bacterium]
MYLKDKQPLKILVSALMTLTVLFASCNNQTTPPQRAGILTGAPNFRDLGGYPSEDGKHTIWQKIFRSQMLAQVSDSDMVKIKELKIKTVIDFRADDEVLKEPSRLPEGLNIVRLPIDVGSNDTLQIMQKVMAGALDSAQCVAFMQTANRRFVTEFTSQYKEFFNILLQPDSYPIVFHCTAGKDRTGFAAAMLLSALDIEWDTVMNDYLLTNQYLKPQQLIPQIPEQAIPALRQMWGVQPSYLNAAKEEILKHYGSINNYLHQELNMGQAEKTRLKQCLLE